MAGWVDVDYLNNAIGSGQVYALQLSTSLGGTTPTDRFTQYELMARARVIAVLQHAGYQAPSATLPTPASAGDATDVANGFLQQMVASVLLNDVYALIPGISLPDKTATAIGIGQSLMTAVYDKKLPVPGLTAVARDGYGGNKFNTTANGIPPVLTSKAFNLRKTTF